MSSRAKGNDKARKLDAEVAIEVFGWRWMIHIGRRATAIIPPDNDPMWITWNCARPEWEPSDAKAERFSDWARMGGYRPHIENGMTWGPWAVGLPPFSTDIAAAWLVVQEITRPPNTIAESERAANTRFAAWWGFKARLWAETPEDAARRICEAAVATIRGQDLRIIP